MATTDKSVATVKPKKEPRPASAARTPGSGPIQKAGKYLQEVRTELKKTTWPTKQELIVQTQVVIALLIVVGIFIAGWDFILGQAFNLILRLMGVRI